MIKNITIMISVTIFCKQTAQVKKLNMLILPRIGENIFIFFNPPPVVEKIVHTPEDQNQDVIIFVK